MMWTWSIIALNFPHIGRESMKKHILFVFFTEKMFFEASIFKRFNDFAYFSYQLIII